jgi:hypothetical protein
MIFELPDPDSHEAVLEREVNTLAPCGRGARPEHMQHCLCQESQSE